MNKSSYVEKIWHACDPLSIAEIVKNFNTIVFTGGTDRGARNTLWPRLWIDLQLAANAVPGRLAARAQQAS